MIEREIKLRFDSAGRGPRGDPRCRRRPAPLPAAAGRCLLDTDDEPLRRRGCALRVRTEGGKSLLTFKGPVQPGSMKIREEHETVVGDGDVLQRVLEELGLHVWFRYEKYREEFAAEDVIVAVDETPVGMFVEIEGGETGITRWPRRSDAAQPTTSSTPTAACSSSSARRLGGSTGAGHAVRRRTRQ